VFEILPPWHRTPTAYGFFGIAALLLLFGASRGSSYLERRRNRRLERVVSERTAQLEATMEKLGEETRHAATLAERDRLAREIHDSVQQGLTGAMLQLDSTLLTPSIDADLRARLNVVRNMVSYSRQEVEHAVWDMESPLLDGGDLAGALRNLTVFTGSGDVLVDVVVAGEPFPLARAMNHNLLRIAQEASTNAFRHARARRISIRLDYGAQEVALEIADDGVGFRSADVLKNNDGHLGLRGMRARAKKLRGTLEIASAPGEGSRIRVVVPATQEQATPENAEAKHDS
jgi:signal transduction histidine kinase